MKPEEKNKKKDEQENADIQIAWFFEAQEAVDIYAIEVSTKPSLNIRKESYKWRKQV